MSSDTDFASETVLLNLFGDTSKTRILSALLSETDTFITKTTIAELAGVSTRTVSRHLPTLCESGIVTARPNDSGYTVYQLNRDSEVAETLARLEWVLLDVGEKLENT